MKKSKFNLTDGIFCLIIAAVGIWAYFRLNVQLNYVWHWEQIPQFLFRYDPETDSYVSNVLMWGLYNTIRLSIWGTIFATILGTLMGIARVSKMKFMRLISSTYVETMRNLPPLVIIFIIYFFIGNSLLPYAAFGEFLEEQGGAMQDFFTFILAPPENFTGFCSAILTLAIFEGAYITEIVRSGIESIRRGQWEAAHSLGLTRNQQMRFVILPQAFRRILPPLAGQFISLIKDSSIVSVISIAELSFRANELMTGTLLTMEIWITVTIMYLILTLPCSVLVSKLESIIARAR